MIKTMLTMFVLCLVLRSAFDYKQSHILISSAERANSNSILKSVLGNKVYDFVSQKAKKHIPRLMVYYDDHTDVTHKFLHYNFTMFDTSWDADKTSLEEKYVF